MIIVNDYENLKNVDLSEIPFASGFKIKLKESEHFGVQLYFSDKNNNQLASFPWWDDVDTTIKEMTIDSIPLGTLNNPYSDLEQSWQILIFKKESEVYILESNEPNGKEFYFYCKVPLDEYKQEWKRIIKKCKTISTCYNSIESALENPENVKKLMLRGLNKFPHEVSQFSNLEILDLFLNNLNEIPKTIGKLKKLKTLNIAHCEIDRISTEIAKCINLESINISSNNFNYFPIEVTKIAALKKLTMNDNRIKPIELPCEIGNLKKLEYLEFTENESTIVPETIGNCKNLDWLILRGNHYKKIPSSICNCTKLRDLTVSDNYISLIPNEIGQLSNLETLNFSSNTLNQIPKEIESLQKLRLLYLNGNRKLINKIPSWLTNQKSIKHLALPEAGDMSWDSIEEETLYDKAYWEDMNNDNYSEAIKKLNKAINLNNENHMNFYLRGLCHLELKKIKSANEDFEKAIILGYDRSEIDEILKKIEE